MSNTVERIKFSGNDEECSHLIRENYTEIISSQGLHNKGSSKLTLKNFVDFNWEHKYYRGQLIALHISEQFMAYGFSKPGTKEGLVRIVHRETDERALIKGFTSIIEDIKFAHLYETIMLACIDQLGTVFVYVIKEVMIDKKLHVYSIFQINGDPRLCYQNEHLLSWCQYIPEQVYKIKELEYEKTYKGKMLAVVRGPEVEIWHIGMASEFTAGPIYGNLELNQSVDSMMLNNIKSALIKIAMKGSDDIISVSFSPDGSNISIAFSSGTIYFYQIMFESEHPPKCVFTWNPEDVFLSLRSLVFLDNHKQIDGDVELWKYVVTLSTTNEIVIWSCETWRRLQKLKFIRSRLVKNPMKLLIDETGKYLFASDIDNNLLYAMEISVDITSDMSLKIVRITEILLQTPMLSMIVVNAEIDNTANYTERCDSGDASSNLNKCTTIINLFAIQPKSLQEGQLIISTPELSVVEQLIDKKQIEPTDKFKMPPALDASTHSLDLSPNNTKEPKILEEKTNCMPLTNELSSLEVHNLVKDKLKLKGIHIDKQISSSTNTLQIQNRKQNKINNNKQTKPKQQTNVYSPKKTFGLYKDKPYDSQKDNPYNFYKDDLESNPNESMYKLYSSDSQEQYSFQGGEEEHKNNIESNYTVKIENEETVFNGSSISEYPMDKSQTINSGIVKSINEIFRSVQDINIQLKCLKDEQQKINKEVTSLTLSQSNLCKNIEATLTSAVKSTNDQIHRKLQILIDQQQKKIVEIVKSSSNSNKVDTELFTKSLVASLSPTWDTILKDLFMSTVIPKFEHACCSMFQQIDTSFTERSLEYRNELKILLNEDGNINCKLEYAFDKLKSDMNSIIKQTEKHILNSQYDMQKQFTFLLQEKSLSHVESFVKDSEIIVDQFMMLDNLLDTGDFNTAFEKALCASNLDLVIYVCEKVQPEELFLAPNVMRTPIVLSMIQQLSYDLTTNTEIKQKYLEAAVGSLNYTSDLHKENINLVLIKMDGNIEKFLQRYPLNQFARKLKMLQFAVKTMIKL